MGAIYRTFSILSWAILCLALGVAFFNLLERHTREVVVAREIIAVEFRPEETWRIRVGEEFTRAREDRLVELLAIFGIGMGLSALWCRPDRRPRGQF